MAQIDWNPDNLYNKFSAGVHKAKIKLLKYKRVLDENAGRDNHTIELVLSNEKTEQQISSYYYLSMKGEKKWGMQITNLMNIFANLIKRDAMQHCKEAVNQLATSEDVEAFVRRLNEIAAKAGVEGEVLFVEESYTITDVNTGQSISRVKVLPKAASRVEGVLKATPNDVVQKETEKGVYTPPASEW